jgi:hypothetical protein
VALPSPNRSSDSALTFALRAVGQTVNLSQTESALDDPHLSQGMGIAQNRMMLGPYSKRR